MKLNNLRVVVTVFLSLAGLSGYLKLPAQVNGNLSGTYSIEGKIHGISAKKAYLSTVSGEKMHAVDSSLADRDGHVIFKLHQGSTVGLYRVSWGKDKMVDLIWNREQIIFSTQNDTPMDSLRVIQSIENQVYFYFVKEDRLTQQKFDLMMPILDFYPDKDQFYNTTLKEFTGIQDRLEKIQDSLTKLYPGSFAVRMIRNQSTPKIPPLLAKEERIQYLRAHFFDKVDFQDTLLLNSNAWSNKAISYISLFGNSKLDQKQLEGEFIKAVTALLSAAAVNAEVYKFILDYIVGGFDKYHFDAVITYIADHFTDPTSCEDQARKTSLQKKLDNFKKLSIGKVAPEISANDLKGKKFTLSGMNSEYTLVIFWSSECGHCVQMMPKVKQFYDAQKPKRVEIMAVSIDTSRTEWSLYVKEEKLNWINVSELKGFNAKSSDDYNIFATPTMFLLDKEKKIIAKPISYRELEQDLRENKLMN